MVQSIWANTEVGGPVYDGFTFGGLHSGTPLLKANYPGLRAVRVGNTITLVDDLPDSYTVPATTTPARTDIVKARVQDLTGGTIQTTAAVKLTAALSIPADWTGYAIEALLDARIRESGTMTAGRLISNDLRLTSTTGTLFGSKNFNLGTDIPTNIVPFSIAGFLTGQTATGTVNVVYVVSVPGDTNQITWDQATLIATAFRTVAASSTTTAEPLVLMTVTVPPPGQILKWLGGPIDIRVELDTGLEGATFALWDSALWDEDVWGSEDPNWVDISPYVFSVEFTAGAQRWGDRFESASASIIVENTEGLFTPDGGADPWHQPFRPGRRLRIVAIPDEETGEKFALFTGQIDSTNDAYDDAGHAITTAILCSDFIAVLQANNPAMLETPTGVQTTHARVNAALDRMDWPVDKRIVQTGLHTMQTSFLAQTTWEECARAADAEGGAFYADREGNAVFKARDWLTTDTRSVEVQAYLGYDEVPTDALTAHVLGIATTHEAARIVNQVRFARVGSTVQYSEDLDSISLFGYRHYQRTDLENNTDTEVAFLANRYLDAFKDDRLRIDAVTITAVDDPDNEDLNRVLYDTRFGDRISVLVEPPWGWSYEKEVHVMGISHSITADDWTVTLQLDDALTYVPVPDPEPELPTIANTLLARWDADELSLSDGADVTSWPAVTGGGTLTLVGGGTAPEFDAGSLNGRGGVKFVLNDHLGNISLPSMGAVTIFMVATNPPNDGTIKYMLYSNGYLTFAKWSNANRWIQGRSEFSFIEFTDAALVGQPCLWTLKHAGTGSVGRANQVQKVTGNYTLVSHTALFLGPESTSLRSDFTMYELLIYNGIASAGDTDLIEDFLYDKWFVP